MNRNGMGIGSSLMILIFTVLCLTILALVSYTSASTGKTMSEASARAVKSYYEADALAEKILVEILNANAVPVSVNGIEITTSQSGEVKHVAYSCPVSERKELHVEIAVTGDTYDILKWHMRDTVKWEAENRQSVWNGEYSNP